MSKCYIRVLVNILLSFGYCKKSEIVAISLLGINQNFVKTTKYLLAILKGGFEHVEINELVCFLNKYLYC